MKKILLATNFLMLGIICIISCQNNTRSTTAELSDTNRRPPVTPNFDEIDPVDPYRGDTGLIDFNLAKKMSMDYKADEYKGKVFGSNGTEDATSIWFSLDRLRDFIANVDASVGQGSCKPRLGIRIYFIKYPSNMSAYTSLKELAGTVANHHSIMMVPTYMDTIRFGSAHAPKNVDFNYKYLGSNPCQPMPYFETPPGTFSFNSILLFSPVTDYFPGKKLPATQYNVLNHGGLTPPPDGEDGTFPIPDSGN